MSEQRKSDWQHPNSYYRKREEPSTPPPMRATPVGTRNHFARQPPNTTAAIFWLKNRRPDRWRDVQQLQSELGVYILSDRPLSEQEWIEQRTVAEQKRLPVATQPQHVPDTSEETEF